MSIDFNSFLKLMVHKKASDLFITAGVPPSIKVHGRIAPITQAALTPQQSRDLVLSVMTPSQREEFEKTHECQFAISLQGVGRFRVSCFYQRNQVGMVLRRIETNIPKVDDLKLPEIIKDLHGTTDQYTWIVTATLLASTATTPIWGKFADLMSKKLLVQISLVLFTIGSILGGMSTSATMLIGFRVIQGIGLGGLQALVIIVIASMFSPRERGRYQGPIAAIMSIATVGGPLLGGVITDTSWLGWRWTFYVCVPLAIIALIVIQQTLNVPTIRKPGVSIDYLGASLIAGGVVILLTWVTLAGKSFAWASGHSYGLAALGVVLLVLAVLAEGKLLNRFLPQFLKVEEIVVMGHGSCGGCNAALHQNLAGAAPGEGGFISDWIAMLAPEREKVVHAHPDIHSAAAAQAMEFAAVGVSLANLRTFPCVHALEAKGKLRLIGSYFAVRDGILHLLDEGSGRFAPLS